MVRLPSASFDFHVLTLQSAGAAGNVLARRLSENSTYSVLVIEAGVTFVFYYRPLLNALTTINAFSRNEGVIDAIVPFLAPDLAAPFSPYTWNYSTVPQSGLDDRVLAYARGRMLGGSSSISRSQLYPV